MTRSRLINHPLDVHIYGASEITITEPSVFKRSDGSETVAVEVKGKHSWDSMSLFFVQGRDKESEEQGLAAIGALIDTLSEARVLLRQAMRDEAD